MNDIGVELSEDRKWSLKLKDDVEKQNNPRKILI